MASMFFSRLVIRAVLALHRDDGAAGGSSTWAAAIFFGERLAGMSRARGRRRRPLEGATNMKFMLMMNAPRGTGDWNVAKWAPEDLKAHIGFMKQFAMELKNEGALVAAEGLAAPGQARVVRAGKQGKPEVTDGPFAESKEFLAGYWIVDVETPE